MSAAQNMEGQAEAPTVEERARLAGWKPKEEFKGPPEQWRDAETFLKHGEEDLPVIRERYKTLENRFATYQRDTAKTLETLTETVRRANETALKRARAEIEAERLKAVETGDVDGFKAADQRLSKVAEDIPLPAAKPIASAAAPASAPVSPEVQAWGDRNPWFREDPTLSQAAVQIMDRLEKANPGAPITDLLERTTRAVDVMFPGRVRRAAEPQPRTVDDSNPRRQEAAPVSSSTASPSPRSRDAKTFENLPADAKRAFEKYAAEMVRANKRPLTKEEYCATYYQDE